MPSRSKGKNKRKNIEQETSQDHSQGQESQEQSRDQESASLEETLPYKIKQRSDGTFRVKFDKTLLDEKHITDLIGAPKEVLQNTNQLSFVGLLQKFITQYGIYSVHVYMRLIKDLIYHKEKGMLHTVKTVIEFPFVVASTVFGGFLPSMMTSSEASLESAAGAMIPFLPESLSAFVVTLMSVLIVTTYGSKFVDKVISGVFNRVLDTPDTILYFTEHEKVLILEALPEDFDKKLNAAIDFLQAEYTKQANKYQDFKHRGDHHVVQKAGEQLRCGEFKPLLKFAHQIRGKKALSLQHRDVEAEISLEEDPRTLEMAFAQMVINDFTFKKNDL